ncbi:MAG: GNAT family N-acetyltransferase [Calditrichaceae bacterium]
MNSHNLLRIEKAGRSEANSIAEFQKRMALETENLNLEIEIVRKGVGAIFDNPERGFYMIVKDGKDNCIGSMLVQKEWSDWRNADVWWLHSVFILPEYRGRGIFRKLFENTERMALESGVIGIRLYVDKSNLHAQQVYAGLQMTNEHYELYEKMF